MEKKLTIISGALAGFILLLATACMPTQVIRRLYLPEKPNKIAHVKYIKVHTNDGGLYVLDDWIVDDSTKLVQGSGSYYDFRRNRTIPNKKFADAENKSTFEICQDDITLIETNQVKYHLGNMAALTVVGVPMAIYSIYCISNPKACFGSCPTFYVLNNGKWKLAAEGFSSSILPSLEKRDNDMLYFAQKNGNRFTLKLTNEALETHAIKYANLLTFKRSKDTRTLAGTDGGFYTIGNFVPPEKSNSREGDCLEKIKKLDGYEQYSLADAGNLAKKEELLFSFDSQITGEKALIIANRQTLLTTYLFYQGLAYTGNYMGDFAASVENGNEKLRRKVNRLWDKLGGIEVYFKNDGGHWEKAGTVEEMGPIATDVHLIKLPADIPAQTTFKLRMTQGLWRIDYLALGEIISEATPTMIQPEMMLKEDAVDMQALKLLNDTSAYLVTNPGECYYLYYSLPDSSNYELFLQTKGYYLEWMREEWLAEQNLFKSWFMFAHPGLFMRSAAKAYKKAEPEMENRFWGSRYVQK